jgi:hypothetical protein
MILSSSEIGVALAREIRKEGEQVPASIQGRFASYVLAAVRLEYRWPLSAELTAAVDRAMRAFQEQGGDSAWWIAENETPRAIR